jgi:hypothetical protein
LIYSKNYNIIHKNIYIYSQIAWIFIILEILFKIKLKYSIILSIIQKIIYISKIYAFIQKLLLIILNIIREKAKIIVFSIYINLFNFI